MGNLPHSGSPPSHLLTTPGGMLRALIGNWAGRTGALSARVSPLGRGSLLRERSALTMALLTIAHVRVTAPEFPFGRSAESRRTRPLWVVGDDDRRTEAEAASPIP